MDTIQSIFYVLASIFMFLGVILMVLLVVLVYKAYQTAATAQKSLNEFKENVGSKVVEFAAQRPGQVAQVLGAGLASFIIKKIKDAFNKD